MTPDAVPPPLRSQPSVRGYTILCLAALTAMLLVLVENNRDLLWALLLAAVGALGVVAHWRFGPPLVLLGLAVLDCFHLMMQPGYAGVSPWPDSPFMDAVLAAAVLAYAAGHYRLLSLVHTIVPVDSRTPPPRPRDGDDKRRRPPDGRQRRSAQLPGPWEMPLLAIAAGVWAVAVAVFWLILSAQRPPLFLVTDPRVRGAWEWAAGMWHGLLLIFLVGATTAVLAGAAAYLHWSTASPEEHRIYLQDQLWRETRREQNRINRFLTWARLRTQRRREQS